MCLTRWQRESSYTGGGGGSSSWVKRQIMKRVLLVTQQGLLVNSRVQIRSIDLCLTSPSSSSSSPSLSSAHQNTRLSISFICSAFLFSDSWYRCSVFSTRPCCFSPLHVCWELIWRNAYVWDKFLEYYQAKKKQKTMILSKSSNYFSLETDNWQVYFEVMRTLLMEWIPPTLTCAIHLV